MRGAASLLWCLAAVATTSVAFHDDDCEVTGSGRPWRQFRDELKDGCGSGKILWEVTTDGKDSEECELGAAAACLCRADISTARACIKKISLQRMLATRWPLLQLLSRLQRSGASGADSLETGCQGLWHPSLDWEEWRLQVVAFAKATPRWLNGELEEVPSALDEALGAAQGVVWKSSSDAVAEGRTIAMWTAMCPFGVLSAFAVRAVSLVLGHNDVYRIVQRAIETAERAMSKLEEVLQSSWPVFQVLHVMSLLKRSLHDTRLTPADLEVTPPVAGRSLLWQQAQQSMKNAAEAAQKVGAKVVIMTGLFAQRVGHLLDLLKHADRLGYLAPLLLVPMSPNLTETCESIVDLFLQRSPELDLWGSTAWSPCLPFVSQFRGQYLYLHLAMQSNLPVLWLDFHLVLMQNPFHWLPDALNGEMMWPSYREPCQRYCPHSEPDIYLTDEFYASYLVKPTLMLLRPTTATKRWLQNFLHWLTTFPFAHEARGLQYSIFPDRLDVIPSVSMLPSKEEMPPIKLGELDSEQHFVSTDGWYGEVSKILSFEINSWLPESDRLFLLETLRTGTAEEIHAILQKTRRTISPKRPTHGAYQLRETSKCAFHVLEDAFISGYAAGLEEPFQDEEEAQCKCLHLGAACQGVTCHPQDGCTVRGHSLLPSPSKEWTWVKDCDIGAGCNATRLRRILHVTYADGCCEREQAQSSQTALQFGAHESRPLRGDFLDEDFRKKNEVLLNFNRTPELTQHKTPSGKIGYYVWKPYVILKTVMDSRLPWDTSVVAWTDAGIHFVGDMWPLVQEYLRDSDVAATRTPMNEGDFSKRDAFVLLDADYPIIMETNQIATGFILLRKTPLAVQFLERWLAACEDRRIMTEEASVLGYPEHPGYKNNNDDQTAFSLLFKLYGFRAFSVEERDAVVYTGRNLAKFIKASDDFALGVSSDREAYLKAADDAAQRS